MAVFNTIYWLFGRHFLGHSVYCRHLRNLSLSALKAPKVNTRIPILTAMGHRH